MFEELKETIQVLLDNILLPHGITSHYMRKSNSDGVATKIYTVYKFPVVTPKVRGDGKELIRKIVIDINVYYDFKTVKLSEIDEYIKTIETTMINNNFVVSNCPIPLEDLDNPFRGYNLEFTYLRVL